MTIQRDDLDILRNPSRWPCWPLLPVKRVNRASPHSWPQLGVVLDCDEYHATVLLCNLLEFPATMEKLQQMTKIKYDNLQELLADGWMVD